MQVVCDGIAPDPPEHALHALEEIFDGQEAPRALVLEVVQDSVANVVDEGKVGTVAGHRRPFQRKVDPVRVVADHLMAADFEDREFSDETNHDETIL